MKRLSYKDINWLKYTNIKWLIVILLITGGYVLCSLVLNNSLLPGKATVKFNAVIESTFSAAVLLLLFEIIQYRNDRKKVGYLAGLYVRKSIVQINEGGIRSNSINQVEREAKQQKENIKYLDDYKYHELKYYDCDKTEYQILLNYEFAGNYTGSAEYYDHKAGKSPYDFPKPKKQVEITLNLNTTDKITGTGSYKYVADDDFGIYEFQVIGKNKDKILIYYKNTFPSGLAEGYEIWEKKG